MNVPETSPPTGAAPCLPATLRLGAAHLTVSDLDRSVNFYQDAVGLEQHRRNGTTAALGVGSEHLLVLTEQPGVKRPGRHAGLYHFALLFESREELARSAVRLALTHTPIDGASDHGVSEALYLADPDGSGIELYRDRPRQEWPAPTARGARVGMFTRPLDMQGLLGVVAGQQPPRLAGPGLTMGHVHLHVNEMSAARSFYIDVLGFEVMLDLGSAAFLAAGGYHHHLGINTWRGEGIPPAPAPDEVAGLRHWTVVLDKAEDVGAVGERVVSTGLSTAEQPNGFFVSDPAGIDILIAYPPKGAS